MNQSIWFAICFILLAIAWSLMYFRRRLAQMLARHPYVMHVLAIICVALLLGASLAPLVIWLYL